MLRGNIDEQNWQTRMHHQEVRKRSDRLMNYFLPGFLGMGFLLAGFYGTWLIAIGVGGICLLAYYSVKFLLPDSDLYQYVLSTIFGVFMAQYIYQMHGLFEMHFFAFIGSAILITYQNWKLQIPMLIVVLVHHALLAYMQDIGYAKVYFTQLDYFSLVSYSFHIALSAVIFFTCGLWSYQLNKYGELRIRQVVEVGRLRQEAMQAEDAKRNEQIQQAAALEKAVAHSKFEMASGVLHDIGNAVVGFGSYLTKVRRIQEESEHENLHRLGTLLEARKPELGSALGNEKAGAVVSMVKSIAEHSKESHADLTESVNDQLTIIARVQEILNIQRQYIGHGSHERLPVNIKATIKDSVAMLSGPLQKRNIVVRLDIAENLPSIKGDQTQLMQVLLNIFKNSMEVMHDNGTPASIDCQAWHEEDLLSIRISNNAHSPIDDAAISNCLAILESHGATLDNSSTITIVFPTQRS